MVSSVHPLRSTKTSRPARPPSMSTTVSSSPWNPITATDWVPSSQPLTWMFPAWGAMARMISPPQPTAHDIIPPKLNPVEKIRFSSIHSSERKRSIIASRNFRSPPLLFAQPRLSPGTAGPPPRRRSRRRRPRAAGRNSPPFAYLLRGAAERMPPEDQAIGLVRVVIIGHRKDQYSARRPLDVDVETAAHREALAEPRPMVAFSPPGAAAGTASYGAASAVLPVAPPDGAPAPPLISHRRLIFRRPLPHPALTAPPACSRRRPCRSRAEPPKLEGTASSHLWPAGPTSCRWLPPTLPRAPPVTATPPVLAPPADDELPPLPVCVGVVRARSCVEGCQHAKAANCSVDAGIGLQAGVKAKRSKPSSVRDSKNSAKQALPAGGTDSIPSLRARSRKVTSKRRA